MTMNNNDTWLLPAIKEAVRDGNLALARSLAALGNPNKISGIPLLEAIRRGEECLEALAAAEDPEQRMAEVPGADSNRSHHNVEKEMLLLS